jgi:hypothetical protein
MDAKSKIFNAFTMPFIAMNGIFATPRDALPRLATLFAL